MFIKQQKEEIIKKYQFYEFDMGFLEVQIVFLIERINRFNEYFQVYKKDFYLRRGFLKMVGQRRKFFNYFKEYDINRYCEFIEKLGLRK